MVLLKQIFIFRFVLPPNIPKQIERNENEKNTYKLLLWWNSTSIVEVVEDVFSVRMSVIVLTSCLEIHE